MRIVDVPNTMYNVSESENASFMHSVHLGFPNARMYPGSVGIACIILKSVANNVGSNHEHQ